ncbi:uncharacterized protein LOC115223662 [Argonauta hians]
MRQYELEKNRSSIQKDVLTDTMREPARKKVDRVVPEGSHQPSEVAATHSKIVAELNKIQHRITEIIKTDNKEDDLKLLEKKHQRKLLLLNQQIEMLQQQKVLERHQQELEMYQQRASGCTCEQNPVSKPHHHGVRHVNCDHTRREDLYLRYNYVDGLPDDVSICRLHLHWFNGIDLIAAEDDLSMSPTVACNYGDGDKDDSNNSRRDGVAVFGNKQLIPRNLFSPLLRLVVEVQVAMRSNAPAEGNCVKTAAWTQISVYNNRYHHPNIGRFSVPIKVLPVNAKLSNKEFQTLKQFHHAQLYYEIQEGPTQYQYDNRTCCTHSYPVPGREDRDRDHHCSPLPPPSATPPRSRAGEGSQAK